MNSKNLENLNNLVTTGQLKLQAMDETELRGLIHSGKARLNDASIPSLSDESRFDLAYNAAHALALAALRHKGYRASNRYIVFQVLPFTADLGPEVWRVLALCHNKRNLSEYEGHLEIDKRLLGDLLTATQLLLEKIETLYQ